MIEELQEINRFGDKKMMDKALEKEREFKRLGTRVVDRPLDNKLRLRNKYNMQIA